MLTLPPRRRLQESLKRNGKRVAARLHLKPYRRLGHLASEPSAASPAPAPPSAGWVSLRRRLRLFGIVCSTFFVFGLWVCCWPLALASPKAMRPIRRRLLSLWGWACLKLINMKVRIYGRPPAAPAFLVLNHLSYVDIWVMSQRMGPVFVAKADMRTWPIFGWFMSKCHQIFIKRESLRDSQRVLGLLNEVFDEEDSLVIFAEGRCSEGKEVLAFRPSLFQAAAERGIPVHFAALSFATPDHEMAPADSIAWWRWEPLADHFNRLLSLSSSTATVYYGACPVTSHDRKELARRTHAGCVELFTPIRQGVLEELPPPAEIPLHLFPEFKGKTG